MLGWVKGHEPSATIVSVSKNPYSDDDDDKPEFNRQLWQSESVELRMLNIYNSSLLYSNSAQTSTFRRCACFLIVGVNTAGYHGY